MQTSSNGGAKTVGQIFKVVGGGTPTTTNPDFWNGSIPWATSADLDDDLEITPRKSISRQAIASSATNLVPAGSIIVATRVGLGKVGVTRTDLCFSQDCQGLIFQPDICDSKFAALQLKLRVQTFKHISRGTTIAGVTKKQLLDVPFDLPSLTEQRRIVAQIEKQFTRLETGVAALQSTQTKLKRYRAAILKAACEDEWPRTTAAKVATEVRYGTSAKTNENADGVPVLRMGNISDGRLSLNKLKFLPGSHPEFPELLLKPGDLLFNRTNSAELVGKTAVYHGTPAPCSFASYLIRVRLGDDYSPDFLSYYLNSTYGRAWIASVVSQQVGQANVNGTKLKALEIPNPPFTEQLRIVAEVERKLSVVEELEAVVSANLHRAKALRQAVLQRAFSGSSSTSA